MEAVESPEVQGGRLISVSEAMKRSGVGRTTIHKALKHIRHARWRDGLRDTVLLYEESFNEWFAGYPYHRGSRKQPGGATAEQEMRAAS